MVDTGKGWGHTFAVLLFAIGVVIGLWDLLAYIRDAPGSTVSHILREWSRECLAVAFFAGFLCGHIWGH